MENIKHLLEKFKAETAKPSIRLVSEWSVDISAADSKLGGNPYLPKDYPYPVTAKGEPLKLLAQINFGQMPKLEHFPAEGILQFFVRFDGTVGMLRDMPTIEQDTFRVIYHEKILPEEARMTEFLQIPYIKSDGEPSYGYSEEWFPFDADSEYLLKGSPENSNIHCCAYEFDDAFAAFCRENDIYDYFELYFTGIYVEKTATKAEYKDFYRKRRQLKRLIFNNFVGGGSRISGYPAFVQEDRRRHIEQLRKYDTLLLQIDSEIDFNPDEAGISWGDGGAANFFINLEDLKRLNFQNVFYTWDSY